MAREVSSKILDGINDLVILAPIKDGFIHAFDNISYATRLRIVAQALNDIRVTAREFEKPSPFADASERILSLLDFRVGVLDQDLFQLEKDGLQSRRYMYLIATFDGVWEPYMRLIWRPLGPLLDLLLCNCEGYVRATESSCDEYLDWVRKSQIDSAVFFTTTGLTVSDQIYLRKLELLQRQGRGDLELSTLSLPDPASEAEKVRHQDPRRANKLALEALGVLYRLSDFYPPLAPRFQPSDGYMPEDGLMLMAAHTILAGWDHRPLLDPTALEHIFTSERLPEQMRPIVAKRMTEGFAKRFWPMLQWYDNGPRPPSGMPDGPEDPIPDRHQLQSGIVRPQGTAKRPATHGALLMFSVIHSAKAREFIAGLNISFEAADGIPADSLFRTIGFTKSGLQRLGVDRDIVQRFPKAFREGMAARASAIGDHWDNHPGNWRYPNRHGSAVGGPNLPVDLSEVDFVVQLRCAPPPGGDGDALLSAEIGCIEATAADAGVVLVACEHMASHFEPTADGTLLVRDHFGLVDGISQPRMPDDNGGIARDRAMFGDILCGYHSSLQDVPPSQPDAAERLQADGSYLVIRKLKQNVAVWKAFIERETQATPGLTSALLAAKIVGREPDGAPLVTPGSHGANDFDYAADPDGTQCPLGAHIRRANPRNGPHGRPSPRIVRRGMSYGPPPTDDDDGQDRGLMFMAYNANIADQFETIQRWLNGGNSTGIASAATDPLTGAMPRPAHDNVFRFTLDGRVIRTAIDRPFVELQWGLYLFVPSRKALAWITSCDRPYFALEEAREKRGWAMIERLDALPSHVAAREWKRVLEDHDAKDPSEQCRTPDIFSAIRWYGKGEHLVAIQGTAPKPGWLRQLWPFGKAVMPPVNDRAAVEKQAGAIAANIVVSADKIMQVLRDPETFSTEVQLDRLKRGCGAIYVSQYPDAAYKHDSSATNIIMMGQNFAFAYDAGYQAAAAVMAPLILAADTNYKLFGTDRRERSFKFEVRREFLAPTLANLCRFWFGLPDGVFMREGHWDWRPVAERGTDGAALCPGDIYAISRNAFYPSPGAVVDALAADHGKGVYRAVRDHVDAHRASGMVMPGVLAQQMAAQIDDPDLLARNLLGMLVAAIPPMDGNLRGILADWLGDRSLWRHQAALRRAAGGAVEADHAAARAALELPIAQAMCKRPSPDLLHRKAKRDYNLAKDSAADHVDGKADDLMILSLVSATQRAIADPGNTVRRDQDTADQRAIDAIPIIFGGDRYKAGHPPHACPGRTLAMGAMTGILAALLDSGRIEAQPAGLILKISGWPEPAPAP